MTRLVEVVRRAWWWWFTGGEGYGWTAAVDGSEAMRRCWGALHRWGFRFAESVFSCIILRFGRCDELHLLGKVSLRSSSFLQRFQLLGGLHGERRMLGGDALVQTLRLRDAVN